MFANDDAIVGAFSHSSTPIRPSASNPPTPEPDSPVSFTGSYESTLTERPAKRSFDLNQAQSIHPLHAITSSSLPLPATSSSEASAKFLKREGIVEIKHPAPRRFASHTVLLQRSSSRESSIDPEDVSDSPGPPPPRSPLRLRRDPTFVALHNEERATPKTAPMVKDVREYNAAIRPIKPTVITDCTGPIKRPKSRGNHAGARCPQPISHPEREERTRVRKFHDRHVPTIPFPTRTIDAVIAPLAPQRHRLRKARPHIQIPDPRPSQLTVRAPSSASSNASWKKITESTWTPVSAMPSEETSTVTGEQTGYTTISPTTSNGSESADARMALSPVMLVAEEIPVPKTKVSPKPTRLVLKEARSYTPRPRSASIPRSAMKRRSRQGAQGAKQQQLDDAPPLPSPPPNRALPPTPPASGSERPRKSKAVETTGYKKELPFLPRHEMIPNVTTPPKRSDQAPRVATQDQRRMAFLGEPNNTSRIHARLEDLERQNTLLRAAFEAMLCTGGTLNGPLPMLGDAGSQSTPMAWESRIARRSAASHAASSSNGSGLDMYLTTRQGSNQDR